MLCRCSCFNFLWSECLVSYDMCLSLLYMSHLVDHGSVVHIRWWPLRQIHLPGTKHSPSMAQWERCLSPKIMAPLFLLPTWQMRLRLVCLQSFSNSIFSKCLLYDRTSRMSFLTQECLIDTSWLWVIWICVDSFAKDIRYRGEQHLSGPWKLQHHHDQCDVT